MDKHFLQVYPQNFNQLAGGYWQKGYREDDIDDDEDFQENGQPSSNPSFWV